MQDYGNELLTDNTKIHYCNQCKDCAYWGNADAYSNAYDKCACDIYPMPQGKPQAVFLPSGPMFT